MRMLILVAIVFLTWLISLGGLASQQQNCANTLSADCSRAYR